MGTRYECDLHEESWCGEHQLELIRKGQADKVSGRSEKTNKKTKAIQCQNIEQERGGKLQYGRGVFRFTFTHHPVPVRSLLSDRLGPDGNIGR